MKFLPYILKHLRKNWIRTASTVLAFALCIFLISTLQTLLAAFYGGLDRSASERLVTRNKVSLVFPLPLSYEPRVASVPGVKRVSKSNWFGGVMGTSGGQPDMKNFFPNFAVDFEPYLAMHPEFEITPDERQALMQDMRGAVVGQELADKFGWRLGSTFQLESTIPTYRGPKPFEFVVRAIYRPDAQRYPNLSGQLMLFHWKYLYEGTNHRASVGTYNVQIANASQATAIAKTIDTAFENSDAETKTETEQAFNAQFVAMIGNLALILNSIGLAVGFTILAVSANTMSMSIRERRKEIAVLKTLGYSSALVLTLVLGEAIVIGLAGGSLGVGLSGLLITNLKKIPGVGGFFAFWPLHLSPGLLAAMFGLSGIIGLLSGLVPAVSAYRGNITSMLRQV
jgi:putative ABC transport system permease protein